MLLKKINKILRIVKSAKISIKLTFIYAVLFSLVLLILNAAILFGVRYHLYTQANKQVEDIQAIIVKKLQLQDLAIDITNNEFFSDVPLKENISIRIKSKDGKTLNSFEDYDFKFNESVDNKGNLIQEKDKHFIYKKFTSQSNKNGTVNIELVKDIHNEHDFIEILFGVMAIADFIGVVASIILGYMVSKKMLQPIDHITKTAENIGINNLKERIEIKGPDDELKRLANTFNKMIDRLQGSFDKQVQFVSDASHELRTPVAIIQGYANLLDRWGKDDRAALEKSIYGIKLEAENMAKLIEKLLFLAKGDSNTQLVEKNQFCLNELIDEIVQESNLIEHKHKITSSKNDDVIIYADYKMLKQAIRIFVDNSIKFTPESGTIDISSEVNNNLVKITVEDNGIGIPKEEIENIFDRFYIVDKSRSKEKGGTGLGLSIASWIIKMHQGSINVESEEGKWTKVILTLNLNE